MRFAYNNAIASLLMAAIRPGAVRELPHAGVRNAVPESEGPRGMAATRLVRALRRRGAAGSVILAGGLWHRITLVVGVTTLGLGVATVWLETNEVLLAAFIAGIAVTYALAESYMWRSRPHRLPRSAPGPHHS